MPRRRARGAARSTKQRVCNPCRELDLTITATNICTNCNKLMCNQCADLHHLSIITKLHQINKIEDGSKHTNDEKKSDITKQCKRKDNTNKHETIGKHKTIGNENTTTDFTLDDDYKKRGSKRQSEIDKGASKRDNSAMNDNTSEHDTRTQSHPEMSDTDQMERKLQVAAVKATLTNDIECVIASCEETIESLERVNSQSEDEIQNVLTVHQKLREETLRIINESEQKALKQVKTLVDANRYETGSKIRRIYDIKSNLDKFKDRIDTDWCAIGSDKEADLLNECYKQTDTAVDLLNTLSETSPTYNYCKITNSNDKRNIISIETKDIPLPATMCPPLKTKLDDIRNLLDASKEIQYQIDRETEKDNAQVSNAINDSDSKSDVKLGSDEVLEESIVELDETETIYERNNVDCDSKKNIDAVKGKTLAYEESNKKKQGSKSTPRRGPSKLGAEHLKHCITKEIKTPDGKKPSIDRIATLSNSRIAVGDGKNERVIILTEELEYISECELGHQPLSLAEIDPDTLIVCLRRINKLALVSTTANTEPHVKGYVELAHCPHCLLVVDPQTIIVSMRNKFGNWSLVELKKGHYSPFIEARDLPFTFKTGFRMALLKKGPCRKSWAMLNCCQESNSMFCHDSEGRMRFKYDTKYPQECVTDDENRVYLLTYTDGLVIFSDNGNIEHKMSSSSLRCASCMAIKQDHSKLNCSLESISLRQCWCIS